MNPDNVAANVVPYVHVRHAIHLLYATSPRSRDAYPQSVVQGPPRSRGAASDFVGQMSHRFDKHGNRLPLELFGCGCSLCARSERSTRGFWAK